MIDTPEFPSNFSNSAVGADYTLHRTAASDRFRVGRAIAVLVIALFAARACYLHVARNGGLVVVRRTFPSAVGG